jgi:hypothetical protein
MSESSSSSSYMSLLVPCGAPFQPSSRRYSTALVLAVVVAKIAFCCLGRLIHGGGDLGAGSHVRAEAEEWFARKFMT